MPWVAECLKPNGEPMASTHWPTCKLVGITDFHCWQLVRFHFEHRGIAARIGADHFRGQFPAVAQTYGNRIHTFDHMGVGHNKAIRRDDKTGTDGVLRLGLEILGKLLEETLEVFVQRAVFRNSGQFRRLRAGFGFGAFDIDADHRRAVLFHQPGEIGKFVGLGDGSAAEQNQHDQSEQGFQDAGVAHIAFTSIGKAAIG